MDVDWDRILGMIAPLKRQFESGASRFPLIHHRLIEKTGEAYQRGEPPPHYFTLRKPSRESEWFGGLYLQAPFDGLVVVDGNPTSEPEPCVGWSKLMIPAGRNWSFRFKIASDEGLDHFQALARQVWNLIPKMPISIPIPEHLRGMLADFHPTKKRVLPDWGDGAKNWLYLVHWIGQSRSHPILNMEPVSWIGNGTFPADEKELRRLVRIQLPDSPLLKIQVPVDCLFTESEDAFMDSVWALDWTEGQIKVQRPGATIEPRPSADSKQRDQQDPVVERDLDHSQSGQIVSNFIGRSEVASGNNEDFLKINASAESLAGFERLVHQFALALAADLANPPDIHLVLIKVPCIAHANLTDSAMQELPIGFKRPDLARKPRHSRFPEKITTQPTYRILYLGDERWVDRYMVMASDAATTVRAFVPAVDSWVRKSGPDEHWFTINLWTFLIAYVAERYGMKRMLQQYRWADDSRIFPFAPISDEEYKAWIADEEARSGRRPAEISKDITVSFFQFNAIEMSSELAKWFVDQVKSVLEPAPTTLDTRLAKATIHLSPSASDSRPGKPGKPLKEPKSEAFAAYRMSRDGAMNQSAIARALTKQLKRPFDQGSVSRMIKSVRLWMEAGNPFPDIKTRTFSVDPSRLDLGPRENNARRNSRS